MLKNIKYLKISLMSSLLSGCLTYYKPDSNLPHAKLVVKRFYLSEGNSFLSLFKNYKYCQELESSITLFRTEMEIKCRSPNYSCS